jgi:hypothetical protein
MKLDAVTLFLGGMATLFVVFVVLAVLSFLGPDTCEGCRL